VSPRMKTNSLTERSVLQVKVKKHLVYGSIAAVWIALPAYVTTMGVLSTDIIKGTCIPWGIYSSFVAKKTITSSIFFIAQLLPLTLMVFSYSRIVYALRRKVSVVKRRSCYDNMRQLNLPHVTINRKCN